MHMRIVCILLLLPQRKAGRSWQMVGKDFILCLHIIPVDHMKISPDQKVDCLELEGGKKPSLNERNWIEIHLRSWDLEGFFMFFPSETCSIPLGNYEKHPTSKSGLFRLPCRDLGVVMVLLSQGATAHISRGPMGFDDSINLFKRPQIISTSNFSLSKLP